MQHAACCHRNCPSPRHRTISLSYPSQRHHTPHRRCCIVRDEGGNAELTYEVLGSRLRISPYNRGGEGVRPSTPSDPLTSIPPVSFVFFSGRHSILHSTSSQARSIDDGGAFDPGADGHDSSAERRRLSPSDQPQLRKGIQHSRRTSSSFQSDQQLHSYDVACAGIGDVAASLDEVRLAIVIVSKSDCR